MKLQQTLSYDKLPRIRLSIHAGMKPRLFTIDETPVLIRFTLNQCGLICDAIPFFDSISQESCY